MWFGFFSSMVLLICRAKQSKAKHIVYVIVIRYNIDRHSACLNCFIAYILTQPIIIVCKGRDNDLSSIYLAFCSWNTHTQSLSSIQWSWNEWYRIMLFLLLLSLLPSTLLLFDNTLFISSASSHYIHSFCMVFWRTITHRRFSQDSRFNIHSATYI